jgi:hypothetical protein
MYMDKWQLAQDNFYAFGMESMGRVGPRGLELIDKLATIACAAAANDTTMPSRRRTFGWIRRALVEDISVAFQRGNAAIMRCFRAVSLPATAPLGVGAAA